MSLPTIFSLLVAAFTAMLLLAEHRQSQLGKWLTKPFASLAFVALAYVQVSPSSTYGRVILVGLGLAALGDVLLIPKQRLAFLAGIVAFLLGHVAFIVAFLLRGVSLPALEATGFLTLLIGVAVGRWLWPHVGELRAAVIAYIVTICVMVPAAVGTAMRRDAVEGAGHGMNIALGALAFFFSDLSVARDRFVKEEFQNRLWGLPLYYLAQVLIAHSV